MRRQVMNEWEHEPDRVEFEYLGFKCLILRHPEFKHLCGYIALPPNHPYYGEHYDDIPVEVHGGLTFADEGDGKRRLKGYWWIGFDCGHSNDYIPFLGPPRKYLRYRNIKYVTNELKKLARQLTPEGMLEKHLEVNNG
jgi:hypothetical protein